MREYLEAVNALFIERGYAPPVDFSQKRQGPALHYENVKTWEGEPERRTHMQPAFLDELLARAKLDSSGLADISLVRDIVVLGRYTGHRLAEYGQSKQTKIDYHDLPNGRGRIMKAFCRRDFQFFDKQGRILTDPVASPSIIDSITICWRVQKNRRNGQKISWVCDVANPDLCPVRAALRIYDRSLRLGLRDDQPMCAYAKQLKKGQAAKYITGHKIREIFRAIARDVFPDISRQELKLYSAHMIRVTAAVLLQYADKDADFIKIRLRWEGDSYCIYLRNTSVLAHKQLHAHGQANTFAALAYQLTPLNLSDSNQPNLLPQLPADDAGIYVGI